MIQFFALLALLALVPLSLSLPTTCEDAAGECWTEHGHKDDTYDTTLPGRDNSETGTHTSVRVTFSASESVSTDSSVDSGSDAITTATLIESKGPPLFVSEAPSRKGGEDSLLHTWRDTPSTTNSDAPSTLENASQHASRSDGPIPTVGGATSHAAPVSSDLGSSPASPTPSQTDDTSTGHLSAQPSEQRTSQATEVPDSGIPSAITDSGSASHRVSSSSSPSSLESSAHSWSDPSASNGTPDLNSPLPSGYSSSAKTEASTAESPVGESTEGQSKSSDSLETQPTDSEGQPNSTEPDEKSPTSTAVSGDGTTGEPTGLDPTVLPGISTVETVVGSETQFIPIFVGGAVTEPISIALPTRTIGSDSPEATSSAQAWASEVNDIIPSVEQWLEDPEDVSRAQDASGRIDASLESGGSLLAALGGEVPSSGSCGSVARRDLGTRGLFDFVGDVVDGVAGAIGCATSSLGEIGGDIGQVAAGTASDIPGIAAGVAGPLGSLKGQVSPPSTPGAGPPTGGGGGGTGGGGNNGGGGDGGEGREDGSEDDKDDSEDEDEENQSTSATSAQSTASEATTQSASSSASSTPQESTALSSAITSSTATSCRPASSTAPSVNRRQDEETTVEDDSCDIGGEEVCSQDCERCVSDELEMPPGPRGECTECDYDENGMSGTPAVREDPPDSLLARSLPSWEENELIDDDLVGANLTRRKLPEYTYFGDREGPFWFMLEQLESAKRVGNFVPHGGLNGRGAPAALSRVLRNERLKLGVVNLFGCTSVIIASKKGVWASHFWEVPSFKVHVGPGRDDFKHFPDQFKKDVLDTFDNGCEFDQHPDGKAEGIACHVRNDFSMFAERYEPRIFIITPREKKPGAREGVLEYRDLVQQINNKVRQILPYAPPAEVVDYVSLGPDPFVGDPANPLGFKWTEGKALFLYDPEEYLVTPENGCRRQYSASALWVEQRQVPIFKRVWKSLKCQETRNTQKEKRDEGDACPLADACDDDPGEVSSSSVTASAAPTTSAAQAPSTTAEAPETTSTDSRTSSSTTTAGSEAPESTGVIDPAAADAWPDDACRFELRQESTTHDEPNHVITTMNLYQEGGTTPMYDESGLQFWFGDETLKVDFAKADTGLDFHLNLTFPRNGDGEYNREYPDSWSVYDDGPSWRRWGVTLKYGDVEWESTQTDKGEEAWCDNYPWFENPTEGSEYVEFRLMNCFFPCNGQDIQ